MFSLFLPILLCPGADADAGFAISLTTGLLAFILVLGLLMALLSPPGDFLDTLELLAVCLLLSTDLRPELIANLPDGLALVPDLPDGLALVADLPDGLALVADLLPGSPPLINESSLAFFEMSLLASGLTVP